MANNRLYLVCLGCEKRADALYLGKRFKDGYYSAESERLNDNEWFYRHKHCGGTHDHFDIRYECEPNYDMGGPLATIEGKLKAHSL